LKTNNRESDSNIILKFNFQNNFPEENYFLISTTPSKNNTKI